MSHWSRLSAVLSLLLHLTVVGAAPLADARLEAFAAESPAAHVEDQRAPACPPAHRHLHCLVCRVLHAFDAPVGGPSPFLIAASYSADPLPPRTAPLPAALAAAPLGPRGPPAA